MSSLELECPGCGELLELDGGFAGGVCRCSKCGTLMTVPDRGGHAERIERHERPDAPQSSRPEEPAAAPEEPASSTLASDTGGSSEFFTTDSGRTVRVRDVQHIPTARRRRVLVKATTAIIFGAMMLSIVGACIWAVIVVTGGSAITSGGGTGPVGERFAWNRGVNPWTIPHANVLGLPIFGKVAVVLDATGDQQGWLHLAQQTLEHGLGGKEEDITVGLLYLTSAGEKALGPTSAASISPDDLAALRQQPAPGAQASLATAVGDALAWEPTQVILITGRHLSDAEIAAVTAALKTAKVHVDVVVARDAPDMQDLARSHEGRYVLMPRYLLEGWQRSGSGQ